MPYDLTLPEGSVRAEMFLDVVEDGWRLGGPWEGGIIQGPIESGKSVAAAGCIYGAMCLTPRWDKGKRRSKWLVTRNSYPELQTSTIPTWLHWFPEEVYGRFSWSEPYTPYMKFLDVEAEVVFQSFADDKPETLKSLRSTEWTGAWINEGQFMPRRLVMEMTDRTGRYPPVSRGGSGRKFLVMDMNAPQTNDHWVLRMRGDVDLPEDMPDGERMAYKKPQWLRFYTQPAALIEKRDAIGKHAGWQVNPKAENLENMKADRYLKLAEGKTLDEIKRDLCNEVVESTSGAPCFPNWDRDRHSTPDIIEAVEGLPLYLGFDWGATPAMEVFQNVGGQWRGLGELVETNCLIVEFAPKCRRMIAARWPWALDKNSPQLICWGDPEGEWRDERTGATSFGIMRAEGFHVRAPWTKDNPQLRLETGRRLLAETTTDNAGHQIPRVLCSRHPTRGMPRFCAGMGGGYVLKMIRIDGQEKLKAEPVKNAASHPCEAGLYAWCGGGEARATLGRIERPPKLNMREIAMKSGRRKVFRYGLNR
jgi:hypothetical protein